MAAVTLAGGDGIAAQQAAENAVEHNVLPVIAAGIGIAVTIYNIYDMLNFRGSGTASTKPSVSAAPNPKPDSVVRVKSEKLTQTSSGFETTKHGVSRKIEIAINPKTK